MRTIALIISLAFSSIIYSQVNIIPQPESINMGNGAFILPVNAGIISTTGENANFKKSIDFLTSYLETYYKSWAGAKQKLPPSPHPVTLGIDIAQNPLPGSYTLEVNKNGIESKHMMKKEFFTGYKLLSSYYPHMFLIIRSRSHFLQLKIILVLVIAACISIVAVILCQLIL